MLRDMVGLVPRPPPLSIAKARLKNQCSFNFNRHCCFQCLSTFQYENGVMCSKHDSILKPPSFLWNKGIVEVHDAHTLPPLSTLCSHDPSILFCDTLCANAFYEKAFSLVWRHTGKTWVADTSEV